MLFESVMAGFGGQGILYLGDVLAQAALEEGHNVTFMPVYGAAMRGGTANCVVTISDDAIGSPLFHKPNAAVLMNQQSLEKFQPAVQQGGVIIANASIAKRETFSRADEVRVTWIPATEMSVEIAGSEKSANIVALGALIKAEPIVKIESVEAVFKKVTSAAKRAMIEKNLAALLAGYEFA